MSRAALFLAVLGLELTFLHTFLSIFGNTNIYSVAGVSDFAQIPNWFLNLFIPGLLPARSSKIGDRAVNNLFTLRESWKNIWKVRRRLAVVTCNRVHFGLSPNSDQEFGFKTAGEGNCICTQSILGMQLVGRGLTFHPNYSQLVSLSESSVSDANWRDERLASALLPEREICLTERLPCARVKSGQHTLFGSYH